MGVWWPHVNPSAYPKLCVIISLIEGGTHAPGNPTSSSHYKVYQACLIVDRPFPSLHELLTTCLLCLSAPDDQLMTRLYMYNNGVWWGHDVHHTHQLFIKSLVAFGLLLLQLGLFLLGSDALLLVVVELCVFLSLQHLRPSILVFFLQFSWPAQQWKLVRCFWRAVDWYVIFSA